MPQPALTVFQVSSFPTLSVLWDLHGLVWKAQLVPVPNVLPITYLTQEIVLTLLHVILTQVALLVPWAITSPPLQQVNARNVHLFLSVFPAVRQILLSVFLA